MGTLNQQKNKKRVVNGSKRNWKAVAMCVIVIITEKEKCNRTFLIDTPEEDIMVYAIMSFFNTWGIVWEH